jgi:hypothetical protein
LGDAEGLGRLLPFTFTLILLESLSPDDLLVDVDDDRLVVIDEGCLRLVDMMDGMGWDGTR